MDFLTLFGIAVALAMDAFAVALGTSVSLPRLTGRHLFRFGFHFGLFQALMPIIGWLAGLKIRHHIEAFDHWLAFLLLALVGGKMLWEAFHPDCEDHSTSDPTRGWSLISLSIATSIDALAVGLTLSMLGVSIWTPALVIGLTAGILTLAGMFLGRKLGQTWGGRVEILGGLILIGIGLKILLEHTLLS
ncbi:MAG: manganese efflux pump MntP family protein [Desulfuromonadales bacterium]|jgi:putative Mn2+ efflux pump MntP|nr:manganese efflux pump MntP family protein [Desulfuromonadales bacterium]